MSDQRTVTDDMIDAGVIAWDTMYPISSPDARRRVVRRILVAVMPELSEPDVLDIRRLRNLAARVRTAGWSRSYATLLESAAYQLERVLVSDDRAEPGLVLSTGTWQFRHKDCRWRKRLTPTDYNTHDAPTVGTVQDCEALAAYLRDLGQC